MNKRLCTGNARRPQRTGGDFLPLFLAVTALLASVSCSRTAEMSREEIESLLSAGKNALLENTVHKPWQGEQWVPGLRGGDWRSAVSADPKSFNLLVAERDGSTSAILDHLHDSLMDYNYITREWQPNCASGEIHTDEVKGTLSVIYTLRDDLFWTFYGSAEKIPVTSDDVIFWYNEIEGDSEFRSSAYNSQFITLEDGSEGRVTIRRIDDKRFAFDFPRIDSNPFLSTNRNFGPRFLYKKAKDEGGVKGVMDLFSIASDPRKIPSMGMWHLTEYTPGQRLIFTRNPHYWKKDGKDSIPYPERKVVRIIPEENTRFLLFKQAELESYGLRPEDLEELAERANPHYAIYSAGGSLGASFWSFNQNPANSESAQYSWFTKKEFRQAMSSLLHRDRIIAQTYRGLAVPKTDFFPEPNPFYNPSIRLEYLYNPERALALLASIGMERGSDGIMRDVQGRPVEFDLTIPSDVTTTGDIASIIADECSRIGISVRIRATDFQKIVEQLTATFDWQSVIIGLGVNYWPTQGSNVWPSTGNLHLWHPLQEQPATEWEARIDWLYNEGSFTLDRNRAQRIWDEYQSIILEQCPVIYLVRPRNFTAVDNRWDTANLYYDNIGGLQTDRLWLKQEGQP